MKKIQFVLSFLFHLLWSHGGPPPLTSLIANLHCNVWRVDLCWEYATALPTKYTPPIDTVMMEVKGPTQVLNECFNLTQSDVSCSFNLTEGGIYSVKLITMNAVGATSNEKTFNFDPLSLDFSDLKTDGSPGITITLNSLCVEPFNQFFVGVLFGANKIGEKDCIFLQSKTVYFVESRIISISLDIDAVTILPGKDVDYEYCAKVTLNNEPLKIHRFEDENKEEWICITTASSITFIITLFLSFPLGVFTGCCWPWCKKQTLCNKPQKQTYADYDEPLPVGAVIPMSDNLAYDHMEPRRN